MDYKNDENTFSRIVVAPSNKRNISSNYNLPKIFLIKGFCRFRFKYFFLLVFLLIGLFVVAVQHQQLQPILKKIILNENLVYKRHAKTKNLSCSAYFDDSEQGRASTAKEAKRRVAFDDAKENDFKTDCESIRNRGYYPDKPLSKEEAAFPLAFARVVYKNYVFIETVFRSDFAPQNTFCFAIDVKADKLFKKRMGDLRSCFPENLYISDAQLDFGSNGKNMSLGHLSCLEKIRHRDYRYVLYLQNDDFKLKTNRQMVEILSRFQGANDISATKAVKNSYPKANYTLAAMQIFKNASKNDQKNAKGQLASLRIVKSLVEITLSRSAADYILDELNVTTFIKTLEQAKYGMDEDFMGTLNANEIIGMPGGFTLQCLDQNVPYRFFSSYSVWHKSKECRSGKWRHYSCVFGIEDLPHFGNLPKFIANKFQQTFDFGAVDCFAEKLFNMTYREPFQHLNYTVYENSAVVRFNKLKNSGGNLSEFKCKL